jgi:hypothetical protein
MDPVAGRPWHSTASSDINERWAKGTVFLAGTGKSMDLEGPSWMIVDSFEHPNNIIDVPRATIT